MGVAILFHFVFTCFQALSWPLLSMVYPLYASIEATERNSISDTQKLITYWICFAVISLFEYFASVLLEWLPFWAFVKLSIICCLVAPHFDGSLYMYKRFIRPVHVEKENWYKTMKKRFCLRVSIILLEAKNYFVEIESDQASHSRKELKIADIIADILLDSSEIEDKNPCERIENEGVGSTERVTKIMTEKVQKEWTCEVCDVNTSSKSVFQSHLQGERHKVACEVLKSKSGSTTGEQGTCSICQTVITTRKDMIQRKANCALLKTQQPHGYATSTVLCNSSQHEQGTAKSCTSNEIKNGSKHLEKIKKSDGDGDTGKTTAMPKLRAEPKDVVAVEQIENEVSVVEVKDRGSQDSSRPERVHKEWTCEVCEVRTSSESNLQSHLKGKWHKVGCEILKSKSQGTSSELLKTQQRINNVMPHGYATSDVLPKVPCNSREQKQGAAKSCTSKETKNQQWRCALCNLSCSSKGNMDSHRNGRKHLAKIKKFHGDETIGKPEVIPNLNSEKKKASKQDDSANERCQKHTKQVLVRWQFPEPGWIKVNVDGSVRNNGGKAGCGGVFRNDIGDWMLGFAHNIGSSSITSAELWGIYTALDLARKWRFSNICVESDSLVAINLVKQGCDKAHPQASIVHAITRIMKSLNTVVFFQHTLREGNRVADWLANWSLDKDVGVHEVGSPPDKCRAILMEDRMGVTFLRRVKM